MSNANEYVLKLVCKVEVSQRYNNSGVPDRLPSFYWGGQERVWSVIWFWLSQRDTAFKFGVTQRLATE